MRTLFSKSYKIKMERGRQRLDAAAGFFNLVAVLRGSADLVFPASGGPRHANQGRCWSSSSTYTHTRRDKHTHTHTHTHTQERSGRCALQRPATAHRLQPETLAKRKKRHNRSSSPVRTRSEQMRLRKCCQHDRRSHRRWCRCSRALAQLLFDLQRCRRFGFHGLHHGSTATRRRRALLAGTHSCATGTCRGALDDGDPRIHIIYAGTPS